MSTHFVCVLESREVVLLGSGPHVASYSVPVAILLLVLAVAVMSVTAILLMKYMNMRSQNPADDNVVENAIPFPHLSAVEWKQKMDTDILFSPPRAHQGSFIEAVELPELPKLNSEHVHVNLSCSATPAGTNVNIIRTAQDLRVSVTNNPSCPSESFIFPADGLQEISSSCKENQGVAHV